MASSHQADLLSRFVPLSLFAEVAREVVEEYSGATGRVECVFLSVTCINLLLRMLKSKVVLGIRVCVGLYMAILFFIVMYYFCD